MDGVVFISNNEAKHTLWCVCMYSLILEMLTDTYAMLVHLSMPHASNMTSLNNKWLLVCFSLLHEISSLWAMSQDEMWEKSCYEILKDQHRIDRFLSQGRIQYVLHKRQHIYSYTEYLCLSSNIHLCHQMWRVLRTQKSLTVNQNIVNYFKDKFPVRCF